MKEKYKLYVCWNNVEYLGNSIIRLSGARFFGPALKIAAHINDNDSISLDVTSQCIEVLNGWEIATLRWGSVASQTASEVSLNDAVLVSDKIAASRLLSRGDRLLIDTENHEDDKHIFNFVYKTKIINEDTYIHTYRG